MTDRDDCVGEPRTGSRRFWTTGEEQLLRDLYPVRGAVPCLPRLPGRTLASIYAHAATLGLVAPKEVVRCGKSRPYKVTPEVDEAIRRVYLGAPTRQSVKDLARSVMRPRWWVSRRASVLGLTPPRFKEPPWTAEEDQVLHSGRGRSTISIQRSLKRRGYSRSQTAIAVRRKRMHLTTSTRLGDDEVGGRTLARLLGVDSKTVGRWHADCGLPARRAGTARTEAQHGDELRIGWADLRRWMAANPHLIDLRKAHPQRGWLISLLTGEHMRLAVEVARRTEGLA